MIRLGLLSAMHMATGIVVGGIAVLACAYLVEQGKRMREEKATPPAPPTPPPPEMMPTG